MSNRLPLRMEDDGKGGLRAVRNVGGLATGLGPLHEREGNLWIGCAEGLESASRREQKRLENALTARSCRSVLLDPNDYERYYEGLSNSAVWPLFHGFPQFAMFDEDDWAAYVRVNERFRDAVLAEAR